MIVFLKVWPLFHFLSSFSHVVDTIWILYTPGQTSAEFQFINFKNIAFCFVLFFLFLSFFRCVRARELLQKLFYQKDAHISIY